MDMNKGMLAISSLLEVEGDPGIEPRPTESKAVVLPLHQSPLTYHGNDS